MIKGRELVKNCIASILDNPSIYMGGPTLHNKKRADKILELLEEWGYKFEEFEYEESGEIKKRS